MERCQCFLWLQEGKAAAEQACSQAEQELAVLKENQRLDFERIGLLAEENSALQVNTHQQSCLDSSARAAVYARSIRLLSTEGQGDHSAW